MLIALPMMNVCFLKRVIFIHETACYGCVYQQTETSEIKWNDWLLGQDIAARFPKTRPETELYKIIRYEDGAPTSYSSTR